jgi:formate/nitrite transporter FocA (FNT family)
MSARRSPKSGVGSAEEEQESKKSYQTILEQEIASGLKELERSRRGLFFSGLSAGLDIGFSVLLMAVVVTLAGNRLPEPVVELLLAGSYSIGFIFVVLGRSELFTEHTTLAFLPVLDGRASLRQLARLWGIVYASNLLGAAVFAAMVAFIGPALGSIDPHAFGEIASRAIDHDWWVILASAVLAGWMMGLLSWLVTASRDTIGQIVIVALVTSAIGIGHLHHSVVGAVEVFAALLAAPGTSLVGSARFLVCATLGNAIGGVFFVGLVKYAHASQGGRSPRS